MAHDSSKYFWINKDQKNIKERYLDFEVNSFVQRQRKVHRKKRHLKLQASIKARHFPWGFREVNSIPSRNGVIKTSEEFDDSGALVLRTRNTQPDLNAPEQVCVFPSQDELDPFLPLAGTITRRDRCLLHYYLSITPAAVYGTAKSAEDCIVRDQTVKFVQMNNTWLHWVLFLADRNRLGPVAAETSPVILARKTYLYRKMYDMVADAKTRHSDITITALSFAAWAEARSSGLERAQNHLLGVTHMVQGRGGLVRLPPTISHPIPYPFIWMGIGARAFPNARFLEDAISSFLYLTSSMRDLQRPHQEDTIQPDAKTSRSHQRRLQTYVQARRQAFGPLSALRPFLQVPFFDSTNRIQMRSHVALLWSLNKTLWEVRSDLGESISFLRELDRRVTASDPTAQCVQRTVTGPLNAVEMQNLGLTNRKPTLKAHALVHIFANCSMTVKWPPAEHSAPVSAEFRDVRWYDSSTKEDDDVAIPPVVRLCETADVVELLQLLSEKSRQKVLDQLSAWLLADDQIIETSNDTILSDAEFEIIADEMRCAWVKARQDLKGRKT